VSKKASQGIQKYRITHGDLLVDTNRLRGKKFWTFVLFATGRKFPSVVQRLVQPVPSWGHHQELHLCHQGGQPVAGWVVLELPWGCGEER
jgi:hypothetical protein